MIMPSRAAVSPRPPLAVPKSSKFRTHHQGSEIGIGTAKGRVGQASRVLH